MAVNSTITGIVIYRVSGVKSRPLNVVLSMDLSNNVHYRKNNSKHELFSFKDKTSVQEKTTVFIINNVSETDGGEYSLHIRREGKVDLHSEVKLIVKSLGE